MEVPILVAPPDAGHFQSIREVPPYMGMAAADHVRIADESKGAHSKVCSQTPPVVETETPAIPPVASFVCPDHVKRLPKSEYTFGSICPPPPLSLKETVLGENGKLARPLHILIPASISDMSAVRSEEEALSHNFNKDPYKVELLDMTAKLGWQPTVYEMLLSTYDQQLKRIPSDEAIFNLCDGADTDGIAGPSVAKWLADNNREVYGCGHDFIVTTTCKDHMKELMRSQGIPVPNGIPIARSEADKIQDVLKNFPFPVFVKANDSYGSVGLATDSKCNNVEDTIKVCNRLFANWDTVLVEEFIDGDEFTVLLLGDYHRPDDILVYRPAHRKFGKNAKCNWITFRANWVDFWDEEPYKYCLYENDDAVETERKVMEVGKAAYLACRGTGYARVDMRRRNATGQLHVLEVNALPGIGLESSSDNMLVLQGWTTLNFVREILNREATHKRILPNSKESSATS